MHRAPSPSGPRLPRLSAPAVVLAAILVAGAVLRLETIAGHLSNDEGYSYLVGSAPSAGAFLHRLAAYENTPPLFYALLTALPLGSGAAWLRLPAAVPGALIPLVAYLALRRPLGARVALLAAAIVAVAPFEVSYSDYSRGFMLENLGCMLAMWAMLRIVEGASRSWWAVYVGGALVALYSEYLAAVFLVALSLAAAASSPRHRLRRLALALLPLVALLPWAGQIEAGQHALNHTKAAPTYPDPSPSSLRDVIVRLFAGEHGAGSTPAVRWLELLVLAAILAAVVVVLWRRGAATRQAVEGRAVLILLGTGGLVLAGHALARAFGPQIFAERYLTILIPICACLAAAAISPLTSRWAWPATSVVVALVGLGVFAQRSGREYEPDLAPVRAAVDARHPRTVLTNSAVVAYYLRALRPVVDRPFGLGRGLESACAMPCVVVDDSRVAGGACKGPGSSTKIGYFDIRTVAAPLRGRR